MVLIVSGIVLVQRLPRDAEYSGGWLRYRCLGLACLGALTADDALGSPRWYVSEPGLSRLYAPSYLASCLVQAQGGRLVPRILSTKWLICAHSQPSRGWTGAIVWYGS